MNQERRTGGGQNQGYWKCIYLVTLFIPEDSHFEIPRICSGIPRMKGEYQETYSHQYVTYLLGRLPCTMSAVEIYADDNRLLPFPRRDGVLQLCHEFVAMQGAHPVVVITWS